MTAISLSLKPQLRYLSALLFGVLISFGLFFLMQSLIDSGEQQKNASAEGQIMDFIRIREDETLSIKDRMKPKKPMHQIGTAMITSCESCIALTASGFGGGPFLGNWAGNPLAEGDVLPIVRIDPQWPREALIEGIEGYVVVEVTIGADGSVKDVHVLQSEPKRMFDRNVIRAVLKWKFKPRIINGVAVERKAIQMLEFTLNDLN